MTDNDHELLEMAREAGINTGRKNMAGSLESLGKFSELVRARYAERNSGRGRGGHEMSAIKTKEEIERVLRVLPENGKTRFSGMTYEQGIEEALLWVLGQVDECGMDYFGEQENP